MKLRPKINIIVPVYKAEQSISRCIGSILDKIFTGRELLLVDDGLQDRIGEIRDEYARIDKRLCEFHKGIDGVSSRCVPQS